MELLIMDTGGFSPELYAEAYDMLEMEKRARVDRAGSEDKRRMVAGDFAARRLVSKRLGVRPEDVIIKTDDRGKPYVMSENLHISIAHSGVYALSALSERVVGADIEQIGRVDMKVAARICSSAELTYVAEQPDLRATQLWTMKEAFSKATGNGIFSSDGHTVINTANGFIKMTDEQRKFYLYEFPMGYCCAVCELL